MTQSVKPSRSQGRKRRPHHGRPSPQLSTYQGTRDSPRLRRTSRTKAPVVLDSDDDEVMLIKPNARSGHGARMNETERDGDIQFSGTRKRNVDDCSDDELAHSNPRKVTKTAVSRVTQFSDFHGSPTAPKMKSRGDIAPVRFGPMYSLEDPQCIVSQAASGSEWRVFNDKDCVLVTDGPNALMPAFERKQGGERLPWLRVNIATTHKVRHAMTKCRFVVLERASGKDLPPNLYLEFASIIHADAFLHWAKNREDKRREQIGQKFIERDPWVFLFWSLTCIDQC
jgi:hypothetical protein